MALKDPHDFLEQVWPLCAGRAGFSTPVGSHALLLDCPDDSWMEALSRGFWKISQELEGDSPFHIRVIGRSDLERLPPFPLTLAQESVRGRIEPWCTDDFLAVGTLGGLFLADRPRGRAVLYYAAPSSIPIWDLCAPLRTALGFLLPAQGYHLLHGAAVSFQGSACLLVGKGGSGKSSSALSALNPGSSLEFVSEDYTLVESESLTVHPLYRSFKVGSAGFTRMPYLERFEKLGEQDQKICSLLDGSLSPKPARLKAVLWPDLHEPTLLGPIPRATALLKLAPSTLFQNPNARREDFQALAALCRRLDSYCLGLGRQPSFEVVEKSLQGLLGEFASL
ncbi:MAG: hypothetical protein WC314_04215 [Vulcanimicrobiota bacterium]